MSTPREPSRARRHSLPEIEPGPLEELAVGDSEAKVHLHRERRGKTPGSPTDEIRATNPNDTKLRLPTSITVPLRGAENALLDTNVPLNPNLNPNSDSKPVPTPQSAKPRRLPVSVSRSALDKLV